MLARSQVGAVTIQDLVVASPQETLAFENILRRKRGLDPLHTPSVSWEYLLTKSQKRPGLIKFGGPLHRYHDLML